jgi:hypothetical protein
MTQQRPDHGFGAASVSEPNASKNSRILSLPLVKVALSKNSSAKLLGHIATLSNDI